MFSKKLIKNAAITVVISALSAGALAEDDKRGNRDGRNGINIDRVTEALELTPDQVVQIEELMASAQ